MDEIERGRRQAGAPGICLQDLHVRQPLLDRERAGQGEVDRVDIHAHHAPVRADPLAEQFDDSAWAAAKIDRALTRSHIDLIEQGDGQGLQFGGLSAQPVRFGRVSAQGVHASRRRLGTLRAATAFCRIHDQPPLVCRDESATVGGFDTAGLGHTPAWDTVALGRAQRWNYNNKASHLGSVVVDGRRRGGAEATAGVCTVRSMDDPRAGAVTTNLARAADQLGAAAGRIDALFAATRDVAAIINSE